MADLQKGAALFNFVRDGVKDPAFKAVIPEATNDNISVISSTLFSDDYSKELNQFIDSFVNRIGKTVISNKERFENDLRDFKKGTNPLGTDIQDVFTNPAIAEKYGVSNEDMADVLKVKTPDTKVAYYRRNRQDRYKQSLTREALQGAFVSWDSLSRYWYSVVESLYSGAAADEYEYTKDIIDQAYESGKVITVEVDAVTNKATAEALLQKCRATFIKMTKPSTQYNAYSMVETGEDVTPVKTYSKKSNLKLITTADVKSIIDVYSLAAAYNKDFANFLGKSYEVDAFKNSEIQAILCDESWFQIWDNLFKFENQYNTATMIWQMYLHVWGTFAVSFFSNCVFFVTKTRKPATAVSLGEDSFTLDLNESAQDGGAIEVTTSTTPEDSTSKLTYESSDETKFTVDVDSENDRKITLTPVAVGEATLTMSADSGVSAEATVTVTDTTNI